SKKIHDDLYNYSKINYLNHNEKVEIICPKHGSFWQVSNSHLNGHGCPKCKSIISKHEIEFLNYLNIPNTKIHRQVCILRKRVDGIKDNTIYEFLGEYYHGNPKGRFHKNDYNKTCHKTFGELYEITLKRFNLLKAIGYKIKYIWESDW